MRTFFNASNTLFTTYYLIFKLTLLRIVSQKKTQTLSLVFIKPKIMKKITFLLLLFFTVIFSFAQNPIITAIADGDCTGGLPKVVEIYADGTVDFSLYSLEKSPNGAAFGSSLNLQDLGTVTDDFVYIYKDDTSDNSIFSTEFPSAVNTLETTSGAVSFNGDDGIRIVLDSDASVIDQYGEAADGTGTPWEYKDGYAKRLNGTSPNGTFTEADWGFHNGDLNGEGTCQGGSAFETIIGIGTYESTASETPTLTITSPSDGQEFAPETSDIVFTFNLENFNLSSNASAADGNGYLQYSVDNDANYTDLFSTDQITLPSFNAGEHTLDMQLVDNDGNVLNPEVSDSVDFTILETTEISSIANLRAAAPNEVYTLTGEALLTYQQSFRNQKYIEDATAAILIDDENGTLITSYTIGDGITGITGELSVFNGILQFVPVVDAGAPTSTGNTISPQLITLTEFNAAPENYASEYVVIENASIDNTSNPTWETGTIYGLATDTDEANFRTSFHDADYIGEDVPTGQLNIAGIITREDIDNTGTAAYFFTARDLDDLDYSLSSAHFENADFSLYPNPASQGTVNVKIANQGEAQISIYNILGERVLQKNISNGRLNVSGLQSGMYLIQVSQDDNSVTKKLIVN